MIHYYKKGQRLVLTYKAASSHFWEEHWENHYEETSIEQTAHLFKSKPLFESLMSHFSVQKKDKTIRILEAGCGPGSWVKILSDEKLFVTGVDFALSALKAAKTQWEHLPLACSDIKRLPFSDETFDSVLSFGVVEHFVEGPEKALEEAYRVLKSGGYLFISVPYYNPFRQFKSLAGFYKMSQGSHEDFYAYFFTKKEFNDLLTHQGFRVQKACIMEGASGLKAEFPFLKRFNLISTRTTTPYSPNPPNKADISQRKQILRNLVEHPLMTMLFGHMILFVVRK